MAQDISAYNKRVARAALTLTDQRWLRAWAKRYRVFSFRHRYASAQPGSYGAAFVTHLTVRRGGRAAQSVWDGTSQARGPAAAAGALRDWAQKVTGVH